MDLRELVTTLAAMPKDKQDEVYKEAFEATKHLVWVPNPGPQTDAYFCEADEVFYGGQAGGGKTDLSLGLALTQHRRSLVLRRTNKEATGLAERMEGILGTRDGFNSQTGMWRRPGRAIELGGCQNEEDKQKYKGIPHDLICFDEVSDFTESQYTFIIGWNRSAVKGQRCRIMATGNPPTRPEGLWVVKRWAAWLDPTHHNPAIPGELRWYTTGEDGSEIEVDGPGPHLVGGEEVIARSRTFIPAKLSDNPDLAVTNYSAVLAGMPERERRAYRDGDFGAGLKDELNQVIPTEWIRAAQARWKPRPPVGVPMCGIGVDVAQGGDDQTVIAPRYDGWFDTLDVTPGKETPDGQAVAGKVVAKRRDGAEVAVDVGGGWGADAHGHLRANDVNSKAYMGVKKSVRRSADRQFAFYNVRAEVYWRFREALDPSQPQGSCIALPPDPELVADLCAPTYEIVRPDVLKIEAKDDVTKRIGRSPDKGDAVVMAWWVGEKQVNQKGGWNGARTPPKVVMGHQAARRR